MIKNLIIQTYLDIFISILIKLLDDSKTFLENHLHYIKGLRLLFTLTGLSFHINKNDCAIYAHFLKIQKIKLIL